MATASSCSSAVPDDGDDGDDDETSASSSSPSWSSRENKNFELALASHDLRSQHSLWDHIASAVPGKSPSSLQAHFHALLQDIHAIDSGLVSLPRYLPLPSSIESAHNSFPTNDFTSPPSKSAPSKTSPELERRKGIPWSEEEHKSFLLGLEKFGKGDWRSISRNFVRTRTPTQVASHAQKYFIRLNSMKKERRRTSIHDITSVNEYSVQPYQASNTGEDMQSFSSNAEVLQFSSDRGQGIASAMRSATETPKLLPVPGHTSNVVSSSSSLPISTVHSLGAPASTIPVTYSAGPTVLPQ